LATLFGIHLDVIGFRSIAIQGTLWGEEREGEAL